MSQATSSSIQAEHRRWRFASNVTTRSLAYTGDTEWVDILLSASRNADLLIAEAYCFERKVRFHLDYATLREKLPLLGAKRGILTHMSADMLGRVNELQDCEAAYDGLEVEIV